MSVATTLPATPAPPPAGSIDLAESIAWLGCRRRTTSELVGVLAPLLERDPGPRGLFLILECLQGLDGSLTGFLLGLEAVLRASGRRVTIADPSGIAPLVLQEPEAGSRVRVLRTDLRRRPARPVLIVDVSGPCGDLLSGVLDSFGVPRRMAQSGPEARRTLRSESPALIVVDLDHPGVEGLELAKFCREPEGESRVIGLTFLKDPWASDAARRFGFRRILSKPAPIAEILGPLLGL